MELDSTQKDWWFADPMNEMEGKAGLSVCPLICLHVCLSLGLSVCQSVQCPCLSIIWYWLCYTQTLINVYIIQNWILWKNKEKWKKKLFCYFTVKLTFKSDIISIVLLYISLSTSLPSYLTHIVSDLVKFAMITLETRVHMTNLTRSN